MWPRFCRAVRSMLSFRDSFCATLPSSDSWPALLPSLPQLVTLSSVPQLQAVTTGLPSFRLCHSWLHYRQSHSSRQSLLACSPSVSATAGYIIASPTATSSDNWFVLLSSLPQLVTLLPVQQLQAVITGLFSFRHCHSWLHYCQSKSSGQ